MPKIDDVIHFEGVGPCYWTGTPRYGCPNKGEWFLSGAIVAAYRARQYLTTEYWCGITPTHYAMPATGYRRGEAVELTTGGIPMPRRVRA